MTGLVQRNKSGGYAICKATKQNHRFGAHRVSIEYPFPAMVLLLCYFFMTDTKEYWSIIVEFRTFCNNISQCSS